MPEPSHWLDDVAEEIAAGLDGEVEWYAEAIRGGARAPFAAPVSEKQKMDTYTRMFFKQRPDGTIDWDAPDEDKRTKLMQAVKIKGYREIALAVMRLRPKVGVRPLDQLVMPPPSALPPIEAAPPYAGPIPLGPPPTPIDDGDPALLLPPGEAPTPLGLGGPAGPPAMAPGGPPPMLPPGMG